jgi:tetratricopeptide (TPR) repeat protein
MTVSPAARADEVADYLRRHGLHRLLAVHLEQQLQGLGGEARDELVLELAGIYALLLESTEGPALLADVQERSRRLLAAASASVGEELRLALLRGSYRGAESIAERHRLRQSNAEEVQRARETFSEIIPKLTRLRTQIEGRLRQTENRLMRSGGAAATDLARRAEATQGLLTQSTFLAAWALYYQSWLNDRPAGGRFAASAAAGHLRGSTLHGGHVPINPRHGSLPVAHRFFGDRDRVAEPAGSRAGLRAAARAASRLDDGRAPGARRVPGGPRLEAEQRSRQAAELARLAVAMLAARGELSVVLDLAERYGTDVLGESGFAVRYVRGVQLYDQARGAHGHDEATGDARVAALYREAIGQFDGALAEDDAERYPEAAASCRWLIGWCRFFQGQYLAAREAFEAAVDHLGPDQAPEAMWMAVVCLDKAVEAGGDDALAQTLSNLIDQALSRFPSSPRAPKLRLKRAMRAGASPEVVEELLDISADNDVYVAARRRAAQILYQLFRQASGEQRLAYGNEYLAVALPLLGAAADELDHTDRAAIEEFVARSRRVLEVALAEGIGRATAAGTVLADFETLAQRDGVDLSEYEDEIDCRRIQQLLLIEDPAAAEPIADPLWERNPESVWTRVAERALFRYGVERSRSADARSAAGRSNLQLVVHHGQRILTEFEDQPEALSQRRVLVYYSTVAAALLQLAEADGGRAPAQQALDLYEKLLAAAPTDARILRATAVLSERLDNIDQALRCWRTLAAGSTIGTEAWYEARFHLITLLAEVDPARARAVMDQHKQLNPDYGPEPWSSRMRQLDLRIPAAAETAPAPGEAAS